MAKNYFKDGEWNVNCMVCGKKCKSGEIKKRWDGLLVCREDYETRHPMDFLRARQERISVPYSYHSNDVFVTDPFPTPAYCTQEGSSGIPTYAVAGCMRPGLGFPNGLEPTVPVPPDYLKTITNFHLILMQTGNLRLMQ